MLPPEEELRGTKQIAHKAADRQRLHPARHRPGGQCIHVRELVDDMEHRIVAVEEDRGIHLPAIVPVLRLILRQTIKRHPEIKRRRAHLPQRRRGHGGKRQFLRPDRKHKKLAAARGGNAPWRAVNGNRRGKAVVATNIFFKAGEAGLYALARNVRAEQPACRRIGKYDTTLCSSADSVPAQLEQRRNHRAGHFIFFHIRSFPFPRWIIARIIPQISRRGYYNFLFFAQFRRQTLFSIHIH